MKLPAPPPAAAAAPTSTRASAPASTTATTSSSPATAPRWTISTRSAPAICSAAPAARSSPSPTSPAASAGPSSPTPARFPWWIFRRAGRVPGTRLTEYAQLLRLRAAATEATVADALDTRSTLYRRLLEPLAVAALNTPPDAALARLLDTVVRETLMKGGRACVPLYPKVGLSETFIDPALAWLAERGATLHSGRRIAGLQTDAGRVTRLDTTDGPIDIARDDAVILAVPAWIATDLLPWISAPDRFEAIVNLHYRTDAHPAGAPGEAGFLGLIGGLAEWIFIKPGIVSITISAANHLVDRDAADLAAAIWPEVAVALTCRSRRCRRCASSRNAAPPSPPPPSRSAGAPRPTRRWPTSRSPATGSPPACPARSKVPSGPATPPPSCSDDRHARPRPGRRCCPRRPAAPPEARRPLGFELEADATIPAEYVLLLHFLDRRTGRSSARSASIPRHPGRARRLALVP